jgi:hypothetical protein
MADRFKIIEEGVKFTAIEAFKLLNEFKGDTHRHSHEIIESVVGKIEKFIKIMHLINQNS